MPPQQVKQASSSESTISESRENPTLASAPPASTALLPLADYTQVNTRHPLKLTSRDQEQKRGFSLDQLWE